LCQPAAAAAAASAGIANRHCAAHHDLILRGVNFRRCSNQFTIKVEPKITTQKVAKRLDRADKNEIH